ncbi:hypothetical protein L208DRAFT_1257325, partial [Tricholoma matsutake]
SCFPHIVNLACKAVLAAITNLKYTEDLAKGYEDYEPAYANSKDCIATVWSLVNAVHASNLKKHCFSEHVAQYFDKDYKLLWDVITRWSSTLLMISQVLKLKEAIEDITHDTEFKDLHKFQLDKYDWALLADHHKILQVPHAFQDILGAETTPTLCYAIPAYLAFIDLWKKQIADHYEWEQIIQPGIDKLEDYQDWLIDAPTYVVAMGKIIPCVFKLPVIANLNNV